MRELSIGSACYLGDCVDTAHPCLSVDIKARQDILEAQHVELEATQLLQGERLDKHEQALEVLDTKVSNLTNHFNKYKDIMDTCIAKNERAKTINADPVLSVYYNSFQANMNGVYTAAMSVSSGYVDVVSQGAAADASGYIDKVSSLIDKIPVIGSAATTACDLLKTVLDAKAERDTREGLSRVSGVTGNPTEWFEFVADLACALVEAKEASIHAVHNTPTCLDSTSIKTKIVTYMKSTAIGKMVSKVYDSLVEAPSPPVQKYADADALLCIGIIMSRVEPGSMYSLHRELVNAAKEHQIVIATAPAPSTSQPSSTTTPLASTAPSATTTTPTPSHVTTTPPIVVPTTTPASSTTLPAPTATAPIHALTAPPIVLAALARPSRLCAIL